MLEATLPTRRRQPLLARYGAELMRILDRGQAEVAAIQTAKLQRIDTLMRAIVEQSFDGILAVADDGSIVTVNDAAAALFGVAPESLVRQRFGDLFLDLKVSGKVGDGGGRIEGAARRGDGSTFPVELSVRSTMADGERLHVAIVRDITQLKANERDLRHQALHDALTGLPNRVLLSERVRAAIRSATASGRPLALLLLDLDRFKQVNDTLGHSTGDLLLTEVARRFASCLDGDATIARLGGDEFAVLMPPPAGEAQALTLAARIGQVIEEPFEVVPGLRLEVGVSIGIALFPSHAADEQTLLRCADVAMYAAKQAGSGVELYERRSDQNGVRQLILSGGLRQALDGHELTFVYQPQLDLQSGTVAGVEALVRWRHPEFGMIMPSEFVPQAECTGLIGALTRWSFRTAMAQLAAWQDAGLRLGIAVNLSPRSLSEDLPDVVHSLLDRWRVDPSLLTIELTESALVLDPAGARRILTRLHDLGVRLSIDDFGTGYSSLSHLQCLPLDELKIDRSFVVDIARVEQDLVIVRSTVQLAHNLGLSVVAEGLESELHLSLLRDLGCDLGQGFHLCAPCTADELGAWLAQAPWEVRAAA